MSSITLNSAHSVPNKIVISLSSTVPSITKKIKELQEKTYLINKLPKWLSSKNSLKNGGHGWPMLEINVPKFPNLRNAVNQE